MKGDLQFMSKQEYIKMINKLLKKCEKLSTLEFIYILLKKTI